MTWRRRLMTWVRGGAADVARPPALLVSARPRLDAAVRAGTGVSPVPDVRAAYAGLGSDGAIAQDAGVVLGACCRESALITACDGVTDTRRCGVCGQTWRQPCDEAELLEPYLFV